MSFRTVVVRERSKLDLKMNYLVCRNSKETKVFIPEISVLILESTSISITTALLSELVKQNVKIIFCDEKHNPESEVMPYYGRYNSSKRLKQQIDWKKCAKSAVWQKIIENKIAHQAKFLQELGKVKEANLLMSYQVKDNDATNREGHSAKVYFNALFGKDFQRRDGAFTNGALNYGYAVVLACFNREIVKNGYATQLGIWHKNEFNAFNLASDMMEPFRVLVDRIVYNMKNRQNFKAEVLEIFNWQIKIGGKSLYFENAVSTYCQSVFNCLEKKGKGEISFYEL